MLRKLCSIALGVSVLTTPALYASSAHQFVVKKIEIKGLKRMSKASVLNALPFQIGAKITLPQTDGVISDLYSTGYFQDVKLYRENGTIVIQVAERPTISDVKIDGNKEIKTEALETVLNNAGISIGNIFNQTVLSQIKRSLEQEYYSQGKYSVEVKTLITHLPRNRVSIKIDIAEGVYATISRINVVGNRAYTEKTLLKQLVLTTPGLFTFFTKSDQYSKLKMNESLQALQAFYMDRGYLNFRVNSSQISLNPDKEKTYLTINISEGEQYTVDKIGVQGDLILPRAKINEMIDISSGEVFSRAKILQSVKQITTELGNKGYAFAHVNPVPEVDEKTKTVSLVFYVDPGKKVYINQINFFGNVVSNDQVFRQRMLFVEDSLYSGSAIEQSKYRLQRLPYVEQLEVKTVPVAGKEDQVDVNYHVKERSANEVRASIGYSQLNKFIVGGKLSMPNVFGTGNIFSIDAQVSKPYKSISTTFTQPYFTMDGVSQSISLYYRTLDNSDRVIANYSTDTIGGSLTYGIPLSAWDDLKVGVGIDNTKLKQPTTRLSKTAYQFIDEHGDNYNTYTLNLGWFRNTTNRFMFPNAGSSVDVGGKIAIPGSDLTWYKLHAKASWYHAIWKHYLTLALNGGVSYGNGYGKLDNLPFFENYYGGGWGSVRGYTQGTLGPHDTTCSSITGGVCSDPQRGEAIGGNLSMNATANVYFPVPFMTDSNNLRLGMFFDMGNVYSTYKVDTAFDSESLPRHPNFSNLRYSVGMQFVWFSPIAPIGISIAKPLNVKDNDDTKVFQFTIGQVF